MTQFSDIGYDPRVLLALSSSDDVDYLENILSARAIQVTHARSALEVRAALEADRVDLIFMDDELNDGAGTEVLESLRSQETFQYLPVVFLLQAYDEAAIDRLIRAGADEYLLKPLSEDKVMLRTSVLLRVGAERRALLETLDHARQAADTEGEMAEQARHFVEEIVASITTLVLVVDKEGRLRFANRRAREFLAVPDNAVMPPMHEVLGEEFFQQPEVSSGLSVAMETSESVRLEGLTITGRDGRSLIVDMQTGPVHMGDELLTVIALEDVTQRWEAEQELLLEKMKLEDTVNTMGAAVCLIDREQKVIWHNRTFVEWFGAPGDRPCWQIFKHRVRECESCHLAVVFSEGMPAAEEWRVVGPQGQIRAFQNHITPIRDANGQITSALVLTQDVTQQTLRIEQLNLLRQLGSALEANLEMNRLLYMVLSMVTAGHALGFNRAFVFLVGRDERTLAGGMALGPSSREEAFRIWAELSARQQTLQDFLKMVDRTVQPEEIPLSHIIMDLQYDIYQSEELVARVARTGEAVLVKNASRRSDISPEFRKRLQAEEFVLAPMTAKGRCTGVLMADNLYNQRPVTTQDLELLQMFAQHAAMAIVNATTFERLRETIAELNSTRQRLLENERLAAIGKTAAFVAHEIRNPLVTIGGFAKTLKNRSEDTERVLEAAGIILDEIERLEAMLKGVMDFARPSKPVFTVENPNEVIRNSVDHFAPFISEKPVEMEIELGSNLPPVRMDVQQISQVLLNLFKNSSEALGDSPGRILVKSWTDTDRSHVFISVDDNGGGIPQETLDKIFDPFYSTKRYGSGLGLAVCRGIVASHDGILEVLNRPGEGVEMRIKLPATATTASGRGLELMGEPADLLPEGEA